MSGSFDTHARYKFPRLFAVPRNYSANYPFSCNNDANISELFHENADMEAKNSERTDFSSLGVTGFSMFKSAWNEIKQYYQDDTRGIRLENNDECDDDPSVFVNNAFEKTLRKYNEGTHPHRGVLFIGNIIWALTGFFVLYVAVYVSNVDFDADLRRDLAILAVLRLNLVLYFAAAMILIPSAMGVVASLR